jgi:predicted PurR-regulated permease PerM
MTIKWRELFLVSSTSILVAVVVSALFALGVRLITNAQHAVPGARKGKAADIRKEIINRVFAYISFTLSAAALSTFLLGIIFAKQAKQLIGGFFGIE